MSKRSTETIRILLFPTSTFYAYSRGCKLPKLCKILNKKQDIFEFIVVSRGNSYRSIRAHSAYQNSGIRLRRRTSLKHAKTLPGKSEDVKNETIGTYFVDLDVFDQIKEFYWYVIGKPINDNEFAIAIGSETVVPDVESNEFDGDAASDSYSCLGNVMSENDEDNNNPKKFSNIASIALLRCNLLFPDRDSEPNSKSSRGIVARYIIINVANLMTARVFAKPLIHEHMARCVAENSWAGLEVEKAGYSEAFVCQECHELAEKYGPANKFKGFASMKLIYAINKMCDVAEEISKSSRTSYKYLIEILLVVIGGGLTTNLVAGYDQSLVGGVTTYYTNHYYQIMAAMAFYALGIWLLIRTALKDRLLP